MRGGVILVASNPAGEDAMGAKGLPIRDDVPAAELRRLARRERNRAAAARMQGEGHISRAHPEAAGRLQRVLEADRGVPPVQRERGTRRHLALQLPQPGIAVAYRPAQKLTECPFAKSSGGQSPAIGVGEAMEHQADRGQGDHRLGDLG
jgi:hypothetical protein